MQIDPASHLPAQAGRANPDTPALQFLEAPVADSPIRQGRHPGEASMAPAAGGSGTGASTRMSSSSRSFDSLLQAAIYTYQKCKDENLLGKNAMSSNGSHDKALENIAYGFCTSGNEKTALSKEGQHMGLDALQRLKTESGLSVKSQGEYRKPKFFSVKRQRDPATLRTINEEKARKSHYLVSRRDTDLGTFRFNSRYSVALGNKNDSKPLTALIESIPRIIESDPRVKCIKVTSMARQGERKDGLIVYFDKADRGMRVPKAIAGILRQSMPEVEWQEPPPRMAMLQDGEGPLPGGYGETSSFDTRCSHSDASAKLIVEAIKAVVKTGEDVPVADDRLRARLEYQLRQQLILSGYDTANPELAQR